VVCVCVLGGIGGMRVCSRCYRCVCVLGAIGVCVF